jgi:hypothetical protein
MTLETQVIIAFLLYLILFGWIGWRRGTWREFWVLVVTVGAWIVLQERGSIFVRLANFAGKFAALVRSGGLGGDTEDALQAVADAPNVITDENTSGFLFLLWAITVLVTYIITSEKRLLKSSKHNGMAILLGIANGLVFASLLLPVLGNLVEQTDGTLTDAPLRNLAILLSQLLTFLVTSLRNFWQWVQPLNSLTILVIVTLVLVLTALTLRRGAKAKS